MKYAHDIGMNGPRGLVAGVLLLAITDMREGGQYAQAAEVWISSDREDGPFTFMKICESLDLDPAMVRYALFGHPNVPRFNTVWNRKTHVDSVSGENS